MDVSISNEAKSSASTVTNEGKPVSTDTWADRDLTWDDAGSAGDTWDVGGSAIAKEVKPSASTVSNEAKT